MKTRLLTSLCFFVLLLVPGSARANCPQSDAASSEWRATVTAETAVLYSGISTTSTTVALLNRGDSVTINMEITTDTGKWYNVAVDSQSPVAGYVSGKDLGVETPHTSALWEFLPPPEPASDVAASQEQDLAAASRARIERDVKSFFVSKFGRSLPISAFGQTGLHSRLGFDHRNAIDVALNPDSPEGQRLVTRLRSFGVPFITFRKAIPGIATGAHIHVGRPSPRK